MNDSFLAAVAAIAEPPPVAEAPPPKRITLGGTVTLGGGYAQAALDAEAQRVTHAANGSRNHTLNRAAFALGQLVAGGGLSEPEVIAALTDAAEAAGLGTDGNCGPHGIAATIRSGMANGGKTPRTTPAPPSVEQTPANGTQAPPTADGESLLDRLEAALVNTTGLDHIPQPAPLVDGFLYRDSVAWLIGPPGNGKSFLALDVAGCVATGQHWQGKPTKQGNVLYLVAEGLSGIRQRVRAWEAAHRGPMEGVNFLPVAVQASQSEPWDAFTQLCAKLAPALVVIDTQARITVGCEENSARDMGQFVHAIEQVRRTTGACVLVVHHTGKSGLMRGSTALEGAATTIIHTTKTDDLVTVECAKQKDTAPFDPFELRMTPTGASVVLTPALSEAETWQLTPTVARALGEWWRMFDTDEVSVSMLEASGIFARSSFHRNRNELIKHGHIQAVGTAKARRYHMAHAPD